MKRIPSLDGLRAVSIAVVTISHILPPFFSSSVDQNFFIPLGQLGVNVFFVISGYLITTLMLKERDKNESISLSGFYYRRVLRIVPAYATFLGFIYVLHVAGYWQPTSRMWAELLTYTYNLTRHSASPIIGQVWSLCIEEHFYLVWPLVMVVAARRAPLYLLAYLPISAVLRVWLFTHHRVIDVYGFSPTRFDYIGIGCLLAFTPWLKVSARFVSTCAALLLLSTFLLSHSGKWSLIVMFPFEAAMIAVLVSYWVKNPPACLNIRPMVWIGLLSYSLYLGQTVVTSNLLPIWLKIPGILAYAVISYYVIEQPFLKFKDRKRVAAHPVQTLVEKSGLTNYRSTGQNYVSTNH